MVRGREEEAEEREHSLAAGGVGFLHPFSEPLEAFLIMRE